jgi:superfamily II DNA or RNA helicase
LRQGQLFTDWQLLKARGFILAVTGFGKTRIGENAIARCFEKGANRTVNVVVPHKAAMAVWKGVKERSTNKRIRVLMAHTYLNLPIASRTCDLLIVDECHRFTNEDAEIFSKIIDGTENKWVMCLSATLEEKHRKFLKSRGIPFVGQVTMKEARECQYVSEHHNYIVKMGMSWEDDMKLKALNAEFHETWKLFGYELDEILGCMRGGEAGKDKREFYSKIVGCQTDAIYGLARRAHKAMRERKVFLQKAPSKLDIVEEIVKLHPGKNILTFSEFTDVADQLTERLGSKARSFHSNLASKVITVTKEKRWKTLKGKDAFVAKNKDKLMELVHGAVVGADKPYFVKWKVKKNVGPDTLKKETTKWFSLPSQEGKVCNTARSLDEAADIENVEVAILISYSSKARQTIQRIGRVIRFKDGKVAYVYILCLHSPEYKTQELKWLRGAMEELDEYEWITPEDLKTIEHD